MAPHCFYLHRLSPYIIRFSGNFGLRWYGAAYVAGFITGLFLLRRLSKLGRLHISYQDIDGLLTYLIVGVLVGGRLGYVLFYDLPLLTQFDSHFPFWGVLAINQGGMSSHGGFIGITIMVLIFAHKHRVHWLHIGDGVVMVAPLGLFFGRIGNYINGELFGRPTNVPWAVCFPTEIMNWSSEKITHLFNYFAGKGFVFQDVNELISAVRQNDAVAFLIRPLLTPRHPSQLYEAFLEGLVLFAILWWFGKRAKKSGQVSAIFFWAYGVMRIFVEQFREPDVGIGFGWLGLTRGQWLSVGMLFAGGILWYLASRMPESPDAKSGLRQKHNPFSKS